MTLFIIKTLKQFLLLLFFLFSLESTLYLIPTSYSYKDGYLSKESLEIETLALGHSQIYDGFNPEVFGKNSFNLGNSSQTYRDNLAVYRRYKGCLDSLKTVILPIGYNNVGFTDDLPVTHREAYYHKYMGVRYARDVGWLDNFEVRNFSTAVNKFIKGLILGEDLLRCDSLGRRIGHEAGWPENTKFIDNYSVAHTLASNGQKGYRIKGERYLIDLIQELLNDNISVILVSFPVSQQYCFNMNEEQRDFFTSAAKTLATKFGIQYIDLHDDEIFTNIDFFDSCHLSEQGSIKLSSLLSDLIVSSK